MSPHVPLHSHSSRVPKPLLFFFLSFDKRSQEVFQVVYLILPKSSIPLSYNQTSKLEINLQLLVQNGYRGLCDFNLNWFVYFSYHLDISKRYSIYLFYFFLLLWQFFGFLIFDFWRFDFWFFDFWRVFNLVFVYELFISSETQESGLHHTKLLSLAPSI